MRTLGSSWPWIMVVVLLAQGIPVRSADTEADKTALAVEALSRLEGIDLGANPKLKATVLRVLEKTRGTPNFVRLVQQFKLTGQSAGLLEVAAAQPAGESGVDAIRMILAAGETGLIEAALGGTNATAAANIADALGN